MARNRTALLAALGTDNFGSGLFLPVVLLYVTRVIGLPLATAGTVVSLRGLITELDALAWPQPPGHGAHATQDSKPASSSPRSRLRPMNTRRLRRSPPDGHGRSSCPS